MLPRFLPMVLAIIVSLNQPSLAAKTHKFRHSAKHSAVKHILAAHSNPSKAGQGAGVPNRTPEEMLELSDTLKSYDDSIALAKQGDAAAAQGHWKAARDYYQQALDLWPEDDLALYGLGQCAAAAGDTVSAIGYYRRVIYTDDSSRYGTVPGDGYNTNDVTRLMEFVLLLSKDGQEEEALKVYRRAAGLLNYRDGKQYLDVLFPDFGPNGWAYTPRRMEAMAHTAIAYNQEGFDKTAVAFHFEQALLFAPDAPVVYYYIGRRLVGVPGRSREALNNLRTAAEIGDDDIKTIVQKRLKDWNIEQAAKAEQDVIDQQKKQVILK